MTVINTNVAASITANAVTKNERAMSQAMERLSTGQRINSASDDAAGLAISSRMTSQINGLNMAVRNALWQAKMVLKEPFMNLEVNVPESYASNIMTDLNSRKAQVSGVEQKDEIQTIQAQVALSEIFGYSTKLRSLSQGRATYNMQFANYEQVSSKTLNKIKGI